ncbi:MAG TPA: FAD-binding oxidoreductase [Gemmatirosa sp.]
MSDLLIRRRDGTSVRLDSREVARLADTLRGTLLTADAPTYDAVRAVWNGMIDRRPAVIVRCLDADDVAHAVRFAARHDLLVAVRGGGHNIGGLALADDALLIDLAAMRGVQVDPARRTARVEPGATLADFDAAAQVYGLATPLGINSTTGVAGLTLGGGYGWLSRAYGLTVDNLHRAEVVTADGARVTASADENSELFWALRGGGGNFGVVTAFTYDLHPVGPEVTAGLIVHPFDDAAALLRRYRAAVADAPDALTAWVVLRRAPPLPFLAEAVHGQPVIVIATCWCGAAADAARALAPLRAIGTPHADAVGPMPYVNFQALFDPLLVPGARNYWKTHDFLTLDDGLIDAVVAAARTLPGPQCEIFLAHVGGAVSRLPADATAYAGRAAQFVMNVHGRWDASTDDTGFIAWARGVYEATAPWAAAGSAYVNFLTADEQDRVRSAYGANYDRLAAIKARYDPTNRFRVNQNILPVPAPAGPNAPLGTPRAGVRTPPRS